MPHGIDAHEVGQALTEIEGVRAVHDMHIWSLSSSSHALAAHVDLETMVHWEIVLPQLQTILQERFGISHSTLQPEDAAARRACDAGPDCGAGNTEQEK